MYYSEAAPPLFCYWRSFLYALPIGSDIKLMESLRRFYGCSLSLSSLMFVSLKISVAAAVRATFPLLICPMSGGLRYFCGRDKWCYKLFRPALAKPLWLWLWLTFVVELDLGYPSPDLYYAPLYLLSCCSDGVFAEFKSRSISNFSTSLATLGLSGIEDICSKLVVTDCK